MPDTTPSQARELAERLAEAMTARRWMATKDGRMTFGPPAPLSVEASGLVERKVSRGETLWRPTRPLGLAVRAIIQEQSL